MNQQIFFITSNKNKVATLNRFMKGHSLDIKEENLNIMEPQLDSSLDIASYKAKEAFKILKKPLIVEDSSFYINAFDGFPGPYLNYVIRKLQPQGILDLMKEKKDRSCYFLSVAVVVTASGDQITFSGDPEEGSLADYVSTVSDGFGWSAISKIFIPKGATKPLKELSHEEMEQLYKEEKNISALSKVAEWLVNNHTNIFDK